MDVQPDIPSDACPDNFQEGRGTPREGAHDRGILWNDPALGIDWPVGEAEALLSDKDRKQPLLSDAADLFE